MPKLKKFNAFVDTLFPSEVEYVQKNNSYSDEEVLAILERIGQRVAEPGKDIEFDPAIDLRKYSKLMASISKKLQERDVDAYFEWISVTNYHITVDSISPQEQSKISKEMKSFEIGWFHMDSFYSLMQNYGGYLLRRFRHSDYAMVQAFLDEHRTPVIRNREVEGDINNLTRTIAFEHRNKLKKSQVTWLLSSFRDEQLSKKNRFHALLAYFMYHIGQKQWDALFEPFEELERELFAGDFYSRRILANIYANKLIIYNSRGDYERAAYFGYQSVKHLTEDYLYYLNNYVSVLLHLDRPNEAMKKMQETFPMYKATLDESRRVVFASNYCRCLNRLQQYAKCVGFATRFLDDLGSKIFQFKWHYFFRNYFYAQLKIGNTEHMVKVNRNWKLVERESAENYNPHIRALMLAAEYREIKLSGTEFFKQFEILNEEDSTKDDEFVFLMEMIQEELPRDF
jgi:hypothetical protein